MVRAFKMATASIGSIVALFCLTQIIAPFSEAKLKQLRRGMTTTFEVLILWFNGANQLENWTID
jgi:hypothetical protein